MGRLENIIARNRRPNRPTEKLVVSMVLGLIVLLIIALAVFTDFGLPPGYEAPPAAAPVPAAPAPGRDHKRVDGVLLRKAPTGSPAPTQR